jgi:hypothetical protein
MKLSINNITKISLSIAAILLLLSQVFNTKFLQDDYIVLGFLSDGSWIGWLNEVWSSQGGNLWPYGIHALLLTSSVHTVNTSLVAFWTLFVVAAVTLCNLIIFKWILGDDLKILGKLKIITIFSISYLGFEGLFTPGLISAFSYHLASFSHLWPITLLIFALYRMSIGNRNLCLAFVLGIFIGNSNIAESFAAIICFIIMFILRKKDMFVTREFYAKSKSFYYAVFSGLILGFTIIIISPGFWNRAENSVGLPSSASEFIRRFFRSFSSFAADLLTHPMFWLSFLVGILLRNSVKTLNEKAIIINQIKLLLSLGLILFGALTIGSTFAYVSWHQSSGLYQVFISLSFLLGFYSKTIFNYNSSESIKKIMLVITVISLLLLSLRANLAFEKRETDWDNAFKINVCKIKKDPKSKLIGAEMLYPGFNLGIEDVSSWEWMRSGYSQWVSSPKFKSKIDCP